MSSNNRPKSYIELIGGPFCGGIIEDPPGGYEMNSTIHAACNAQENTNAWDHLDAVYRIRNIIINPNKEPERVEAFMETYVETEF
jgi:hypothetical protein